MNDDVRAKSASVARGDKLAALDENDKNIEMWKIKRVRGRGGGGGGVGGGVEAGSSWAAGRQSSTELPPRAACSSPQLIKGLETARGNGTSMISLVMPPKDQVRLGRREVQAGRQAQQEHSRSERGARGVERACIPVRSPLVHATPPRRPGCAREQDARR